MRKPNLQFIIYFIKDLSKLSLAQLLTMSLDTKAENTCIMEETHQEENASLKDSGDLKPKGNKNKKKSVGFAPSPDDDLNEHHEQLKKKRDERRQSNPFHKIPPELSYLNKRSDAPRPLPSFLGHANSSESKVKHLSDLKNLRYVSVKDISLQNKDTELNFNYPSIDLPIASNHILVDVKYASLNSFDLSKVNNYVLNVSNTKVGLGFEFSGEIIDVGSSFKNSPDELFAIGKKVVGCVNGADKKGSLTTTLLVNPTRDTLIVVDDNALEKLESLDTELSFKAINANGDFELDSSTSSSLDSTTDSPQTEPQETLHKRVSNLLIEEELPPLAKLSSFPVLYCRARQVLSHSQSLFESTGKASILVNGADTNLGFTIIQLLNSSAYKWLKELKLILAIRECNYEKMSNLVKHFTTGKHFDPSQKKRIHLIPFDMVNEDLVLPGEKTPVNYKKPELFASDVLNALLGESEEPITKRNINNYKLDLIIDIVGSRKYLQTLSIRYNKLESISLPFLSKISPNTKLTDVLNATTKEPFLMKILKPKASRSCVVSCCKFSIPLPTYNIDELIDHSTSDYSLNPWSMKWSGNLANSVSKYNYYEDVTLLTNTQWVKEGLDLFLAGELKFRIDDFVDWRKNFKKYIKQLKKDDGKVIFKIEDF